MIVLLNDHKILGLLLVAEALTRGKQPNQLEALSGYEALGEIVEMGNEPCAPSEKSVVSLERK